MKMRDEYYNSEELPSPQELMPLTQSLITPTLALAFNITLNPNNNQSDIILDQTNNNDTSSSAAAAARTLKRPRLVWTPQLHKRFVDAVAHLGIKNAVPKTIMQLMSVDGLTRENVASHLQKYRLYLKRMQGIDRGIISSSASDAAMDRLFASSPVPPQFLRDHHFMPPPPPVQQSQHFMRSNGGYEIPFIRQQQQEDLESPRGNGKRILTLFPSA